MKNKCYYVNVLIIWYVYLLVYRLKGYLFIMFEIYIFVYMINVVV